MKQLKIEKSEVFGEITISSSKNSTLPIICLSLLNNKPTTIKNIPKISDIDILIKIINYLNVKTTIKENDLIIDPKNITYKDLLIEEVKMLRASSYLMSVMLYHFDKCTIYTPGGCKLGKRPLDYHFLGFLEFGYETTVNNDIISIKKIKNINNISYKIPGISLGATINLIVLSLKYNAKLYNYSKDPEVIDSINYINKVNKNIKISNYLDITNNKLNKKITYKPIPDRVEAISYIVIGLISGMLKINNINIIHIDNLLKTLILHNADITILNKSLIVKKSKITPFDIITNPYPETSTDIAPILSILNIINKNEFILKDNIYNRYNLITELNIPHKSQNNTLHIYKTSTFKDHVRANDLRMAFALLILGIHNNIIINDYHFLERGYNDIYNNLAKININFNLIDA